MPYITWYVLNTNASHDSMVLIDPLLSQEFVLRETIVSDFHLLPLLLAVTRVGKRKCLLKTLELHTVTADMRLERIQRNWLEGIVGYQMIWMNWADVAIHDFTEALAGSDFIIKNYHLLNVL